MYHATLVSINVVLQVFQKKCFSLVVVLVEMHNIYMFTIFVLETFIFVRETIYDDDS